jgi:hypothetical protein
MLELTVLCEQTLPGATVIVTPDSSVFRIR